MKFPHFWRATLGREKAREIHNSENKKWIISFSKLFFARKTDWLCFMNICICGQKYLAFFGKCVSHQFSFEKMAESFPTYVKFWIFLVCQMTVNFVLPCYYYVWKSLNDTFEFLAFFTRFCYLFDRKLKVTKTRQNEPFLPHLMNYCPLKM